MNAADLAELEALEAEYLRRLAKRDPRAFIPQEPTERQRQFLAVDGLEALYGGAAGGGKSSALLMAAAQYVHVPGYSALLLRRTYADLSLPGAIMDRAKEWWMPLGVNWHDKEKRFTFPSGATITFGYLDTAQDKYRYQGAELQFIGFDELTQFGESDYRYLLSRLRRLQGVQIPVRARAASNPGGVGHDWVRRRFVDGSSGTFVPATLEDNPHLDAAAYRVALEQLDPITRRQLLEGVWVRDGAGLVYQYDEAKNTISDPPPLTSYLLGIDYGVVDATAFAVMGWREHDPTVYVVEAYKVGGMSPSDAAEEAKRLEAKYKFVRIVGDVGGLGKGFAEEARRRFQLPVEAAEKHNKLGFISLLNGDLARERIRLVKGACEPLIAEWLELPWDKGGEKEAASFDNHCSDAALYAWRACVAYHEQPAPPRPAYGTKEYWDAEERDLEGEALLKVEKNKGKNWWDQ